MFTFFIGRFSGRRALRVARAIFAAAAIGGASQLKASILFEEKFFNGWSVVQPVSGDYFAGPLRWEFDPTNAAIVEQSNIYTDDSTYSASGVAPMLINDTVTGASFTYTARLTAGDDDGFGLIFGYQDENNFYRVTFARQARSAGFPWHAWVVERSVNGAVSRLFGYGTPGYVQTFVNTANRPFNVTVTVDALNRLTLTVLDNPTGSPTSYPLVTAQTLPSAASGRVGVFTWGMGGGTPPGFRIQNLNLTPLALTGNLYAMTNWTPVVPPRMVGNNATQSGAPAWLITARPTAPSGALEETGNCYLGNDLPGQVDFSGAVQVAGNTTWSNYVVAARITPFDDDAHGIVFRYQNVSNFYRIVLRSEVSSNGPPTGLSVQKNVGRVYTEIYRDNPVVYNPTPGVPYDLVAQIATNTLNVCVVADPDNAAMVYNYGPFTVTGLSTGEVGLVSWGMAQTVFDSISVQDGASLYISSPFGTPTPTKGLNSYSSGTLINASVGPAAVAAGARRTALGWVGSGSVPATGVGTNVSFTIDRFSRLHWQWQTEYQLSATNGVGGTVSYPPGDWFLEGSNVTVTAVAAPGYAFAGWQGDAVSFSSTLNLVMTQPYNITATFTVDSDGDGLPDAWEMAWFGNLNQSGADDPDGDGQNNTQEFANGTNPTVPDILRIDKLQLLSASTGLLTVSNNTGTRYSVEQAVTLPSNWATLSTLQTTNIYVSPVPTNNAAFWRLSQPARPGDVPPFVPGSWTLVVLPDTQFYSESYPELFKDQTRWIVANKDRYNIKYVLHLGDIVNVPNALIQWTNARAAITLMDGKVPYALATGNHDHGTNGTVAGDRGTYVNNYFPVSNYTNWPTFGGTMEPNRIENSYHLFSAGGVDWIIFSLEWGPRNGTAAWASMIASNYPTRKKILITHAYMYFDETRYDWATKGTSQAWNPHSYGTASDVDGTNDGEELWNKLVKIHPGFVMTFNGHVLDDGLGKMSSTNNFGDVVHQMLVNYQMKALGGEAFLRLVEFHPDGKTVQVKAYSPYYGTYKTDPQNQFQLNLQPPLH